MKIALLLVQTIKYQLEPDGLPIHSTEDVPENIITWGAIAEPSLLVISAFYI